ncbi:GNAT family N-acetyltransferase [Kangiella shandongensis]|uniref:GNAT family N-acetyltransferase n=1 Tax=Kangiella shandongensis TaxID=2763258 RepID=UPI001CBEF0AC|nr:GNAT family N-acetyltransferase [Kangiella shandongensis]
MQIENAYPKDASELAYLINLAGEGIPEYLWSGMAEGAEPPLEIGAQRAAREEGGFSYKNARVIRDKSGLLGMIISYQLDDPYILDDIDDYPEIVKPLVKLESKAPGSWYINAVATKENHRGKGIAKALLSEAESKAKAQGVKQMSLIVASENTVARKLYTKLGYQTTTSLPVVDYPGAIHGGDWELMIKQLS